MKQIKVLASKTAAVAFCLLIFASVALASAAPADPDGRALDHGSSELGFWGGYSPDNPTAIGITTNRPFGELNLQYARVLVARDNWALKWTIELVPIAVISQPRQVNVVQGKFVVTVDAPGTQRAIYGAGTSPIGLQVNFRRHRMVQPYVNGTAGVLYFTDQGMELRGTRPIKDDPDVLFRFVPGRWYGWPDYSRELEQIGEDKYQPPSQILRGHHMPHKRPAHAVDLFHKTGVRLKRTTMIVNAVNPLVGPLPVPHSREHVHFMALPLQRGAQLRDVGTHSSNRN